MRSSRRKRRIAYLGLQKHISEAEARKRKREEEVAKAKADERAKLENEAKLQLSGNLAVLSPRRSGMNELPSWAAAKRSSSSAQPGVRPAMPVGRNAIPLRKAPDGAVIKMSREARALSREETNEEGVGGGGSHRAHRGSHWTCWCTRFPYYFSCSPTNAFREKSTPSAQGGGCVCPHTSSSIQAQAGARAARNGLSSGRGSS